MSPRERVLVSLTHREPDRVPIGATITPQVAQLLSKKFNVPFKRQIALLTDRISYNNILTRLGNDLVFVGACAGVDFVPRDYSDGSFADEWGIRWKRTGYYDEIVRHPVEKIETVAQLDRYFNEHGFPDSQAKGRFDFAKEETRKYFNEYLIVGVLECTMFELSWYLTGMEKFLIDLAMNKDYIFKLLDMIMRFHIEVGKKLIEIGCDIIWTGDDFGTQRGMLIPPEMWRRIFKPRFASVFKSLKQFNPNIKIAYHSCGSIVPIIPDLIEIGLDILNPLQPRAEGMDGRVLKKKYADRLSFFGAIDEQKVLPFGSPEEVKEEVREKISDLAQGGGYILAPAHNIQPDTSLENIFAIYEAVEEYGKYPIHRESILI